LLVATVATQLTEVGEFFKLPPLSPELKDRYFADHQHGKERAASLRQRTESDPAATLQAAWCVLSSRLLPSLDTQLGLARSPFESESNFSQVLFFLRNYVFLQESTATSTQRTVLVRDTPLFNRVSN
jgi:hypothetical protein